MTVRTCSRVDSAIPGSPLTMRETVETETPASCAMRVSETRFIDGNQYHGHSRVLQVYARHLHANTAITINIAEND